MTRITVGSITKEPRSGNIGDVYYFHPTEHWSLNSLGLRNRGIDWYGEQVREMLKLARGAGKELWASISPFSAEECGEMADRLLCAGVDGVEINGSCPNVWDGGKHKTIPALHPETAAEMFHVTGRYIGNLNQASFKLSPTRDLELLNELAKVLRSYQVEQLVCCNTIPDQERLREDGKPALSFRSSEEDTEVKHKGGLAGSAIVEESLYVASEMMRLLPNALVHGSGGIFDGEAAGRYFDIGCAGIFSTTGYLEYREALFVDILMKIEVAS